MAYARTRTGRFCLEKFAAGIEADRARLSLTNVKKLKLSFSSTLGRCDGVRAFYDLWRGPLRYVNEPQNVAIDFACDDARQPAAELFFELADGTSNTSDVSTWTSTQLLEHILSLDQQQPAAAAAAAAEVQP